MQKLNKVLTGRFLKFLEDEAKSDTDKYAAFFKEFGHFLKEGIISDYTHRDALAKLLRYETSQSETPAALADYCYTIVMNPTAADIEPGHSLILDGTRYPVTAVGSLVRKNLDGLGHITINFDGATEAALEGTLHVLGTAPELGVGSTIAIEG